MIIWKDIDGYEGLYQINNKGEIKNKKGQILKQHCNEKGYLKIKLTKNSISKTFRVHRLVANAFLTKIENKNEVNHIDNNPKNNKVENLEWCNRIENITHCVKQNRMHNKPIIMFNLSNEEFYFNSIKEASDKTGISRSNIGRCCNKERKTAGGMRWEFMKGVV